MLYNTSGRTAAERRTIKMRFPKAYTGVKLLYIAEILMLVSAVLSLGMIFVTTLLRMNIKNPTSIMGVMALSTFPTVLVSLGSLVLLFVGMGTAMADEPKFRTALILEIVTGAMAVLLGIVMALFMVFKMMPTALSGGIPQVTSFPPWYTSVIGVFSNVMSTCVMLCITSGIMNLAQKLGDTEMDARGHRFQKIIIAFCAVIVAFNVISFLIQSEILSSPFNWSAVLSTLLSLVLTLITVVFLGRAKNMLAH